MAAPSYGEAKEAAKASEGRIMKSEGGGSGYVGSMPSTAEGEFSESSIWSRPVMTGVPPKARGGHSGVLVGNLFIVFGGHLYGGDGKFIYLDDIWAIDVDTMTWHNPKCRGEGPGPRYGHSATVVEYKMYIFGGKGSESCFNDLWCLDVETWQWERMPSTTAPPSPRFGLTSVELHGKLVYFGGSNGRDCFDDLWVYDTDGNSWIQPRVAGPAPTPRHGHVMEVMSDGSLLVFGGYSNDAKGVPVYNADTRSLDTETMVWGRTRVTGEYPPARFSMASCMIGKKMIVFGGYPYKGKGMKIPEPPPTRDGGTAAVKHPHLYILDTDSMVWEQPEVAGAPPSQRYGLALAPIENQILIFGGWDGNRPLNDVLQLDV